MRAWRSGPAASRSATIRICASSMRPATPASTSGPSSVRGATAISPSPSITAMTGTGSSRTRSPRTPIFRHSDCRPFRRAAIYAEKLGIAAAEAAAQQRRARRLSAARRRLSAVRQAGGGVPEPRFGRIGALQRRRRSHRKDRRRNDRGRRLRRGCRHPLRRRLSVPAADVAAPRCGRPLRRQARDLPHAHPEHRRRAAASPCGLENTGRREMPPTIIGAPAIFSRASISRADASRPR